MNLEQAIREAIAEEVERAIGPYVDTLRALSSLSSVPRKPSRAQAGSSRVGSFVRYRQGRGTFRARVIVMERGVAEVERVSDGKRVRRPVSKLMPA
jgi:hypothetical protein